MIEKINIIILVMQNCYIGNSNAMHTTMPLHVLKLFFHADLSYFFAEVYEDDFNASSL